jgi:hypothetical protein
VSARGEERKGVGHKESFKVLSKTCKSFVKRLSQPLLRFLKAADVGPIAAQKEQMNGSIK